MSYIVTGECISRLNELKKYKVTNIFLEQYFGNGDFNNNGVDYINSSESNIYYYIDRIKYNDNIGNTATTTTFLFTGVGFNSPDFIDVPYYKNSNKDNIISNPKISDDVFIVRQELSVFDKNYRLEQIKSISDLITYAGGKFFNIINNT